MGTWKPGSIIIGSTQPARLREWYHKLLAPDQTADTPGAADSDDGPLYLDGFVLVIDRRDDVSASNPEPGRAIVNFHVGDFDAAAQRLESAGIPWLLPVEDRPAGRFGTFADPDGNLLQIIQFS